MSTLTIRVPDALAERLRSAARTHGVSVNKFMTEISVQALAAQDAETRFRTMAAQANLPDALLLLDRLDKRR